MTERDRPGSSKPPTTPEPRTEGRSTPFRRGATNRLTLDFTGPPLPLPGDSECAPEAALGKDAGRTPEGARAVPTPRSPPDAWTTERAARETPGPVSRENVAAYVSRRRASPPGRPVVTLQDETDGDALDLVDRNPPSSPEIDLTTEMAERYAFGDFTGALLAAEFILGLRPGDPEAERYARGSRERLEQLHLSRLGRLSSVPVVALADPEIRWLGLDHRAAFLLSRIDGVHTIEELLDVSGMPRLETLKTLVDLHGRHAIRLTDRG